jgi:hypothetical protein
MRNPFLQHYRTLGIQPGCTPGELKDAYRKLVKKWHPDHYANQPEAGARAAAEQRMREINRAFRSLSDYHKRNGHLPAMEDPAHQSEEPVAPPFRQPGGHFESGSESDWGRPAPKSARLRPVYFILFGAALGILWATWSAYQRRDETPDATAPTQASVSAPGAGDTTPPAIAAPAAPQNDAYFTVGSALGKVYAVQGVPTRTKDGVWYYGKSMVFFTDGVVSRWEEDPDNPLKTKPLTDASASALKTFGVGSTKAEVKAVQGNPLSENDTRWDYGLSQVFFQDGRVTGWHEYPLNPLKTRK